MGNSGNIIGMVRFDRLCMFVIFLILGFCNVYGIVRDEGIENPKTPKHTEASMCLVSPDLNAGCVKAFSFRGGTESTAEGWADRHG
jgi:hypothetical protein